MSQRLKIPGPPCPGKRFLKCDKRRQRREKSFMNKCVSDLKKRIEKTQKSVQLRTAGTTLALLTTLAGTAKADTRIVLRPDMVLNETAFGDASKLVDEQNAMGDPAMGKGIPPK